MSKIVLEYKRLKEKDSSKLYLFKIGKFYCFLGSDAEYINNYMVLKITKFSNEINKCGFPEEKLDNYLRVFNNLKLNVEVVKEYNNWYERLKNVDMETLSKKELIIYLKEALNDISNNK